MRTGIALNGNPSQSYRASVAIWDHTRVTSHSTKVNALRLNPSQRGRYSIYLPRSIFIQIFVVGSERRTCFEAVHNDPSRSSKVVDFGTNRKRVCDFLLVINSNLGPILSRFRDIAGFLLRTTTPIPSEFQGCSLWTKLAILWL